jgi:8-oxo-dGTP pyrophosphatase MutT (NUDIX family)
VIGGHVDTTAVERIRRRMVDRDGTPVSVELATGLCVAACRETFEESGVLLARPRKGMGVGVGAAPGVGLGAGEDRRTGTDTDARDLGRFGRDRGLRDASSTGEGFQRLLVDEDLELDVDRLVYWAHWITPSAEKKRFDTRFFALQVPSGQEASVDESELTHHAWVDRETVEAHLANGEMRMAPPTRATLQDLWRSHARFGGLKPMLERELSREVPPILPKGIATGDGIEVVLPWDAEYAASSGEGAAVLERYPDYLVALPSRWRFDR